MKSQKKDSRYALMQPGYRAMSTGSRAADVRAGLCGTSSMPSQAIVANNNNNNINGAACPNMQHKLRGELVTSDPLPALIQE